jgi:uncharacterized UBP type Zn finger protein
VSDDFEDYSASFQLLHQGENMEEEKEETIVPSQDLLNELYIMGFPHEQAKKALI